MNKIAHLARPRSTYSLVRAGAQSEQFSFKLKFCALAQKGRVIKMSEEIKNEVVKNDADEPVVEAEIEPEIAEEEEPIGNIKISVDVVTTIAGIAASEIEGVSCMYTSFVDGVAQRLGARRTSKGVKVDMNGNSVDIDLYIVVEYGVKIPELAWTIQENVKNSVETMTGLSVSGVNIHIEGISFESDAAEAPEPAAEEE